MRLDLHTHSWYSDGSVGLEELFDRAKTAKISHLALTDHDYLDHLDYAAQEAWERGLGFTPGLELSCQDSKTGKKIHLLLYGLEGLHAGLSRPSPGVSAFGAAQGTLRQLGAFVLQQREKESMRILEVLETKGFYLKDEGLHAKKGPSPVLYRRHILSALEEFTARDPEARAKIADLFAPGGEAFGSIIYPDVREALSAVKTSAVLSVLAHPGLYNSWESIPRLAEAGLDGLEETHPNHDETARARVRQVAEQYHLLRSGGSDWHEGAGLGSETCPRGQEVYFLSCDGALLRFGENFMYEAGEFLQQALATKAQQDHDSVREKDDFTVETKNGDHRDLVSTWDKTIDSWFRRLTAERFPDHWVLSEEGENAQPKSSASVWILDPIDGTTNFLFMGRDFSISLALWRLGKPVIGLVYEVAAGALYRAVDSGELCLNGSPANLIYEEKKPERSARDLLRSSLIDASLNTLATFAARGIDVNLMNENFCGHRSLACASLALTRVALGQLDFFVSDRLRCWDWAAAVLFLQVCGRTWDSLDGEKLDPFNTGKRAFLGARSEAHSQALNLFLKKEI